MEHLENIDSSLEITTVNGVQILGKQKGKVTQSEVESIVCDFSTEMKRKHDE